MQVQEGTDPAVATTYTAFYRTRYRLTITAGAGGTVTPDVNEFRDAGTSQTITASANSGFLFAGWTGTGLGSYTGPNQATSLTINGPITQTANFTVAVAPPVLTPMFATLRGPWQTITFTVSKPSAWTIQHAGGAPFTPGILEGQIIGQTATTLTYAGPTPIFNNLFLRVTATASDGSGTATAELNVLTENNTPTQYAGLTDPPGQSAGSSGTFRIEYNDQDGYGDIGWVEAAFTRYPIVPPPALANSCYVHVDRVTGVAYLAADNGSFWLTAGSLGENASIANSQCAINLGLSKIEPIQPNGIPPPITFMRLTLRVGEFKPSMAGLQYLRGYVQDRFGASNGWQPLYNWNVPTPTPPSVTSMPAPFVGGTSAVIRWTTNEAADTQVEFGSTTAYGSTSTLMTALTTSHAVVLSGLNASATYYYRVKSRNAGGGVVTQASSFTTEPLAALPLTIFNTGVSGSGEALAAGSQDTHFSLVSIPPQGTTSQPAIVVNSGWPVDPPWIANTADSKWVSSAAIQSVPGSYPSHGLYTYRTTINLTGRNPAKTVLRGRVAADNIADVRLNGVSKHVANGFTNWSDFAIEGGFQSGINNLDIVVDNINGVPSPTGLRLELSGSAVPMAGPPAAPTSLAATAPSATQVNLTWVDGSPDETGFKLERSTAGGAYVQIATPAANATAYSDSAVSASTQYSYRIRATNANGDSANSNVVTVTTPAGSGAGTTIRVASAFNYQFGGSYCPAPNTTWYRDPAGNCWGPFEPYLITPAVATTGESTAAIGPAGTFQPLYQANRSVPYTGVLSTTATLEYLFPVANGNYSIALKWAEIYYTNPNRRAFNVIVNGVLKETAFQVEPILTAVDRTYAVTAAGGAGIRVQLAPVMAVSGEIGHPMISAIQITPAAGPPAAPSSLVATAASATQVNLTWVDGSSDETGFKLERSTAGGAYVQIATPTANVTAYSDSTVSASTQYSYRIRATNANGDSAYSNVATMTTPAGSGSGTTIRVASAFNYQFGGSFCAAPNTTWYRDPAGNCWGPFDPYLITPAVATTGESSAAIGPAGTFQPLYQANRSVPYTGVLSTTATLEYLFPVANGNYSIALKWAEIYYTNPNRRAFNVIVNGVLKETAFQVQPILTAVDRTYTVTAAGGAGIRVRLVPVMAVSGEIGHPMISAIQITPAP